MLVFKGLFGEGGGDGEWWERTLEGGVRAGWSEGFGGVGFWSL